MMNLRLNGVAIAKHHQIMQIQSSYDSAVCSDEEAVALYFASKLVSVIKRYVNKPKAKTRYFLKSRRNIPCELRIEQ